MLLINWGFFPHEKLFNISKDFEVWANLSYTIGLLVAPQMGSLVSYAASSFFHTERVHHPLMCRISFQLKLLLCAFEVLLWWLRQ